MRQAMLAMVLFALALAGCGKPAPKVVATPPKKDAETILYEMIREGSFQMNAAANGLQEALKTADSLSRSLTGEAKTRMIEAATLINDAGEAISEAGAEPPTLEAVRKDFAKHDDRRLKAIAAANQASMRLELAGKHLAAVGKGAQIEQLKEVVGLAQDDVEGGIEALGGTVEITSP